MHKPEQLLRTAVLQLQNMYLSYLTEEQIYKDLEEATAERLDKETKERKSS